MRVPDSRFRASSCDSVSYAHPGSVVARNSQGGIVEKSPAKATGTPAAQAPESLVQLNTALKALAGKVSQGVVQVVVTGYGPLEENSLVETALIARQRAIGAGVIVDPSGYIVTNAHVVEGARRILEPKMVGTHQESDLAFLKVDAKNLLCY